MGPCHDEELQTIRADAPHESPRGDWTTDIGHGRLDAGPRDGGSRDTSH